MSSPPDGTRSLCLALARPESMAERSPGEWTQLLTAARQTSLLGTLWHLAAEADVRHRLPAPVAGHLKGGHITAERNAEAIRFELRCLDGGLLRRLSAPVALKGAAYLLASLPNAPGRVCNDVDLLLPREELERAESLLFFEGWVGTHHDTYDQRYYREWMHELPPLQHRVRGSTLDLHHNILPETFAVRVDPVPLLAASEPLDGGWRYRCLTPAHLVLHAVAHLFSETDWERGLRDLYDIHTLLQHYARRDGEAFWRELTAEARELGLTWLLAHAMSCCRALLQTAVPAAVVREVEDSRWAHPRRTLTRAVFRHGLSTRASATPVRSALARGALFIRGHWLKMPPPMLVRHLAHKAFAARGDTDPRAHADDGAGPQA